MIEIDEFHLINNWNMLAGDGRSQTMSIKKPLSVEMNWDYPAETAGVKAYPNIAYGCPPWLDTSSTDKLPVQLIIPLPDFIVDVDAEFEVNGKSCLAFDVWMCDTLTPEHGQYSHEMMIWLDYENPWNRTPDRRVKIDGVEYDLTLTSLFVFVAVSPIDVTNINISSFLSYLLNEGLILESEYLTSINFGCEIVCGIGKTVINNYKIATEVLARL